MPNLITALPWVPVTPVLGKLNREIVSYGPFPLLSTRAPSQCREELVYLDWSRFRDDGML